MLLDTISKLHVFLFYLPDCNSEILCGCIHPAVLFRKTHRLLDLFVSFLMFLHFLLLLSFIARNVFWWFSGLGLSFAYLEYAIWTKLVVEYTRRYDVILGLYFLEIPLGIDSDLVSEIVDQLLVVADDIK